ncbi:hypothetical protein QT381_11740 [Galbitalea sp. SE-J8]|uniref:hypothetical protein n=1 Tax=Galbitalea sp. SE-J8 TaxID=3054952 RepID=UPI00259C70C0|nr:hypothetical protein [Galbitalea sp. SE-J8]MDM4763680.1 hypothetical protein [Galbitalea sp. SE-J8]
MGDRCARLGLVVGPSGLVNSFHQVGMALGLGILVAVSAGADAGAPSATVAVTREVATAFTGGSVLLGLCLVATLVLIVPAVAAARRAASGTIASDTKESS